MKKPVGDRNSSKLNENIQFDITNRSESFAYSRIYLALYFRDQRGRMIDSTLQRFPIRIKPGQTRQVSYNRSKSKNAVTKSSIIALVGKADQD